MVTRLCAPSFPIPSVCYVCRCAALPCPQVRKLVLDMVLSTDMDVHFKLLKRFEDELAGAPDVATWASLEQRSLLFQMLVHLADLANPSRPWHLALTWAEWVVTEFLQQVGHGSGAGWAGGWGGGWRHSHACGVNGRRAAPLMCQALHCGTGIGVRPRHSWCARPASGLWLQLRHGILLTLVCVLFCRCCRAGARRVVGCL
jgi:hypothetical protein